MMRISHTNDANFMREFSELTQNVQASNCANFFWGGCIQNPHLYIWHMLLSKATYNAFKLFILIPYQTHITSKAMLNELSFDVYGDEALAWSYGRQTFSTIQYGKWATFHIKQCCCWFSMIDYFAIANTALKNLVISGESQEVPDTAERWRADVLLICRKSRGAIFPSNLTDSTCIPFSFARYLVIMNKSFLVW